MSEQEQSLLEQQEEQEEETAARPWWGTLLIWLGMVVLIVALIVGGVVLVMYRAVTEEALPDRTVTFAGQTLSAAQWDWQVPVAGFIKRSFSGTNPEADGAVLADVQVSDPQLTLPKGMDAKITLTGADGSVLFEGGGEQFASYRFAADGDYTLAITVTQPAAQVG